MDFARRLGLKTLGVFLAGMVAMAAAATPFDVMTFHWTAALTVSGSAAVLAFLEGLAGKFTGDPAEPTVTR